MLFKGFNCKVDDVDAKGIVKIAVNAFNNEDADGDISAPGAFKKTISENFQRIKHLLNHNFGLLLGIPKELYETSEYLVAVSQMNIEKQMVKDVFTDYQMHAEMDRSLEHSIGYDPVKRADDDKRIIKEYRLFEYSTLTFLAANENTPLLDIKNAGGILDQIDFLHNALHKGDYSDTKFQQIEAKINKLQKLLTRLKPSKDTKVEPKDAELVKIWQQSVKIS